MPLQLYYNPATHDNLTTASPEIVSKVLEGGYIFVRTEGFVERQ
jgi:hypothetical protein